jgi:hypothetical protein
MKPSASRIARTAPNIAFLLSFLAVSAAATAAETAIVLGARSAVLDANTVSNIVFNPPSPATLAVNTVVHASFDYSTTDANGVGVSFIPNTQNSGTSHVYFPPSGSGNESFTSATAVTVTSVKVVMYDQFSKSILFQQTIPVNYAFGPSSSACTPTATTLCIDDSPGDKRFEVNVSFQTSQGGGSSGSAHAIPLSSLGVTHGGLFWFFSADNPELLLKVLNTCSFSPHHWMFASAGTNVAVTIVVKDTQTGFQQTYTNPDLQPMEPIQDETSLPCP